MCADSLWARRIGWLVGLGFEEIDCVATRAYLAINGIRGHPTHPNATRPNVMAKGPNLARSVSWDNIRNTFWRCILREFFPMSPNPAPFSAQRIII